MALCSAPTQEINVEQIVLKKTDNNCIHDLDSLYPDKNYAYSGYNGPALESGKQLKMAAADLAHESADVMHVYVVIVSVVMIHHWQWK